jgi:hypothetical protein
VEQLEPRCLLSGSGATLTLDPTQLPLAFNGAGQAVTSGTINAGTADVNYYNFTLGSASHVHLTTLDKGVSPFVSVISLYVLDSSTTYGFRLLAQDDGAAHGGDAVLDQSLAAGTYFVAVSGSGNRYFFPFLADSGFFGSTGAYTLQVTATANGLDGTGYGPVLLPGNALDGTTLHGSPLVLRVDFSEPLNPGTLTDPNTGAPLVQLVNTDTGLPVTLAANNPIALDGTGTKLQITPAAALGIGHYSLTIFGDPSRSAVILGANNLAVGTDPSNAFGADVTLHFQIDGMEGVQGATTADDTLPFAHELSNVTTAGLIQIAGAIGDDPYYDTTQVDSFGNVLPQYNPANQVNFYHFHVGAGNYALGAEVFAGRIGSPLFPAITLFQVDPSTGLFTFKASNSGTFNGVHATNGTVPLSGDPALFYGVTQGDYVLAVSSAFNYWDPASGLTPDQAGVFNPIHSHSGVGGNSTGNYVLNVLVQAAPQPPHVVATSIADGSTLTAPPTTFTVQFDAPVSLELLAFASAFQGQAVGPLPGIYVQDVTNPSYTAFPRLVNYDTTRNTATFALLDALPNDSFQLHLVPSKVTDFGGNPLVPNDSSGDYVVHFAVQGPARGSVAGSRVWLDAGNNSDPNNPQVLGTLFPLELANTETLRRDLTTYPVASASDTRDYYQINLPEGGDYLFTITNAAGLPTGAIPVVYQVTYDSAGVRHLTPWVLDQPNPNQSYAQTHFAAGTYVIGLTNFTATGANVKYDINLSLQSAPDQPVPLVVGPRPALRLQLVGNPTSTPTPVVVVPPPTSSPVATSDLPSGVLLALSQGSLGGVSGGPGSSSPEAPTLVQLSDPGLPGGVLNLVIVTQALNSGDLGLDQPGDFAGIVFGGPLVTLEATVRGTVDAVAEVGEVLARAGLSVAREISVNDPVDALFARWAEEDAEITPPVPEKQAPESGAQVEVAFLPERGESAGGTHAAVSSRSFVSDLAWATFLAMGGAFAIVGGQQWWWARWRTKPHAVPQA